MSHHRGAATRAVPALHPRRVLVVIGTRPEAIKLAPVILALHQRDVIDVRVCLTSQHHALASEVLTLFALAPDRTLVTVPSAETLNAAAARMVTGIEDVLAQERPDWILVAGDTTTVLAAALAAFHHGVPIAHVEAGLRTRDLLHPFPEEGNRRVVTVFSSLHFPPTETARQNLVAEGVAAEAIAVTGNPGLDALRLALSGDLGVSRVPDATRDTRRLVLVTAHRRESHGAGLEAICEAVARLAVARRDSIRIVFPVHLNPSVDAAVRRRLGGIENVMLLEPLPYLDLLAILRQSYLVLTDSGGLQEEAPALGKPVLVMRETTERPEAIEAGASIMVGRDAARIRRETLALLDDPARYARMAIPRAIFGDGYAADRIADSLIDVVTR